MRKATREAGGLRVKGGQSTQWSSGGWPHTLRGLLSLGGRFSSRKGSVLTLAKPASAVTSRHTQAPKGTIV